MENSGSSRWWEAYLVRYITGSVVGAVIVYVLLIQIDIDLIPCWAEVKNSNLLLLASLGFTYCYLASAPIALLHAVRAMYGYGQIKKITPNSTLPSLNSCRCCSFFENIKKTDWPFLLVLTAGTLIAAVLGGKTHPLLFGISALSGMTLTFLYFMALRLYFKTDEHKEEWQRWYLKLALSRANDSKCRKEYIESYRHLREHGNAFFIVVLELLLGIILFLVAETIHGLTGENKAAMIGVMAIILVYWSMSGAICWFLGNKLESYMVKQL